MTKHRNPALNLETVAKLYQDSDDGYDDEPPQIFRRFTKALYNLTSFAQTTLESYELSKAKASNNSVPPLGSVLPAIIDNYFKPRLFELCYLGAWSTFEAYLRDVAWLMLKSQPKSIALELISRIRSAPEFVSLFKRLFGYDLYSNGNAKKLLDKWKKRNKMVHGGTVASYSSYSRQQIELIDGPPYSVDEKTTVSEEELSETLTLMWRVGDAIRKELLKVPSRKQKR